MSAKTGLGVESVLQGIVSRIPPPEEVQVCSFPRLKNAPTAELDVHQPGEKLRALVFDSWYDSFRGVVSLAAVGLCLCSQIALATDTWRQIVEGEIRKGDSITSTTTGLSYTVVDLGIMSPKEISISAHPVLESRVLRKGMVGWIVCGMKDVKDGELRIASARRHRRALTLWSQRFSATLFTILTPRCPRSSLSNRSSRWYLRGSTHSSREASQNSRKPFAGCARSANSPRWSFANPLSSSLSLTGRSSQTEKARHSSVKGSAWASMEVSTWTSSDNDSKTNSTRK